MGISVLSSSVTYLRLVPGTPSCVMHHQIINGQQVTRSRLLYMSTSFRRKEPVFLLLVVHWPDS